MVSKDKINEIKQAINIVDVIGESVALTKNGRNYLGLCPFHGEKTPSFNVVEDKQFYHCFGCGKSGDVFRFVEESRGLSFTESVQFLADRAGFQLEIQKNPSQAQRREDPHQFLYDIHIEASKFYHALLMTTKMGEAAREYLYKRGLTDDVIRHFQIGLAPQEADYLFRHLSKKYREEQLLATGLFNTGNNNRIYDAFQARIMFPLADDSGRTVAFSGRIWLPQDLDNKELAKYKNSRATDIFNKSYELYHLDKAKAIIKKEREVYLMEGFMDVIAAYRAGVENVVASMGTALTADHVGHLSKYTRKVILCYDGDKAGKAATTKALEELQGFDVAVVSLPDNMDPDEFIAKQSSEGLAQVLSKSRMSGVEFLIHYYQPENPDNLQMQIEFVDRMAPIIAQTKSITAQNSYIYKVADLLADFDYQQVEEAVNRVRIAKRQERRKPDPHGFAPPQPHLYRTIEPVLSPTVKLTSLIRTENQLLARMVEHLYILNQYRLREDFSFYTPELERLYQILKANGEITAYDLAQEEEGVQQAWYRILEEKLPSEVAPNELEDLEANRQKEWFKRDNRQKLRNVREQTHVGNDDAALAALTGLLNQKRKME